MCCFSGHVERVSNTNIFARSIENGRQLLVYSMTIATNREVAMILPLPVPANSAEDAVKFIDLKDYPDFFMDMKLGFPEPVLRSAPAESTKSAPTPAAPPPLQVVEVGAFEASFVPTVKDFSRLDARFRLPDNTWEKLPAYKDYGFAVFKLKLNATTIHPMAFEFPRADATKVFFPTVHIHDGQVHDKADFDHALYCQKREADKTSLPEWRESDYPAGRFVKTDKTKGIVDARLHCYQWKIHGKRKNDDIRV